MYGDPLPKPAEHLHSKVCLAATVIAAVENLRDSAESDFDFRSGVQDNLPLNWADGYLADGTMTCTCPWNYASLEIMWDRGYYSEVLYLAEEYLSHSEFVRFVTVVVNGETYSEVLDLALGYYKQ